MKYPCGRCIAPKFKHLNVLLGKIQRSKYTWYTSEAHLFVPLMCVQSSGAFIFKCCVMPCVINLYYNLVTNAAEVVSPTISLGNHAYVIPSVAIKLLLLVCHLANQAFIHMGAVDKFTQGLSRNRLNSATGCGPNQIIVSSHNAHVLPCSEGCPHHWKWLCMGCAGDVLEVDTV